jgi:hypothetical protein
MTITYSKQVLLKRGNASVVSTYTGPLGELVLNTDTLTVGVHDGATAGGHSVASAASVSTANTAMKGYVDGQISTIIAGAPGALDTLNELANALGNNASFSTTITNSLATLTSNAAVQSGLIADTNTAITTANTAMKGYVDANAATQLTSINNITNGTATFGNIIPSANVTYSLGDATHQWKDLHLSGNTIYLGGATLSVANGAIESSLPISSTGPVTASNLAITGTQVQFAHGAYIEESEISGDPGYYGLALNSAEDGVVGLNALDANASITSSVIVSNVAVQINVANVTYGGDPLVWFYDQSGGIQWPDGSTQTTAYDGETGHMMMIDTSRTDPYIETGTNDRPFKTMAAAIAAVAIANPTGVVPYTFVLMGCIVNENVNFSAYNFNFITFATTCRSIVNGTFTAGNSNLKQLVIRNIEFANTFTLAGDATAGQFANTSLYNVSFSGAFNATTVNNLAFYEVAFFGLVVLKNINYVYTNGAQFNTDLTFTVDDSGATAIPSNGIAPMIIILFSAIANNVYMTHVGTGSGFIVFQPHMSRMGLSASTYTIPAGFVFQPQGCAIRGTWVNNGSVTLRDSSFDVAVTGTAPAYTGVIGGDRVVADRIPTTSKGATGDRVGMLAAGSGYIYACTLDWTNGSADIWSRTAITATTW